MKKIALLLLGLMAGSAQAYDRNELNFWSFTVDAIDKIYQGDIDKEGAKDYTYRIVQRLDAALRRVPLAAYTAKYSGTSCVVDFRVIPPNEPVIDDVDGDKIACNFIIDKLKEAHLAPIDELVSHRVKDFQLFFQFTDYEQYLDNSK